MVANQWYSSYKLGNQEDFDAFVKEHTGILEEVRDFFPHATLYCNKKCENEYISYREELRKIKE
ncbi:MAG: hypothetical protein V1870_02000 [Candidatus Aenigmatarchaeota archaeon]